MFSKRRFETPDVSHVNQRTQKGSLCFASSLLHSCAFDFHPVRVSLDVIDDS